MYLNINQYIYLYIYLYIEFVFVALVAMNCMHMKMFRMRDPHTLYTLLCPAPTPWP